VLAFGGFTGTTGSFCRAESGRGDVAGPPEVLPGSVGERVEMLPFLEIPRAEKREVMLRELPSEFVGDVMASKAALLSTEKGTYTGGPILCENALQYLRNKERDTYV
jgi:hypothetical protein